MSISRSAKFTYLTDRQLRYFETYGWGPKGPFPYILREEKHEELPANPKIHELLQAVTNQESQEISVRQQKHEEQITLANNTQRDTLWEEEDTYDDTWESGRL